MSSEHDLRDGAPQYSQEERMNIFFESKDFSDRVESIRVYLEDLKKRFKNNENFFVREPNTKIISYCLGKIIRKTPELFKMFAQEQDDFSPLVSVENHISHRICAMLTYQDQKKPGVPAWTYNLDLDWDWEMKLAQILTL